MWCIFYVKYFTKLSLQDFIYEYILSKLNADQSSILPWGLSLTFISRALCCMFIIICPHKCIIDPPPTQPPPPPGICVSAETMSLSLCAGMCGAELFPAGRGGAGRGWKSAGRDEVGRVFYQTPLESWTPPVFFGYVSFALVTFAPT